MTDNNNANPMLPYLGRLVDVRDIATEIKMFKVEMLDGGKEAFHDYKPGQFAFVSVKRPSASPTSPKMEMPPSILLSIAWELLPPTCMSWALGIWWVCAVPWETAFPWKCSRAKTWS
jgi:hypothetical protein